MPPAHARMAEELDALLQHRPQRPGFVAVRNAIIRDDYGEHHIVAGQTLIHPNCSFARSHPDLWAREGTSAARESFAAATRARAARPTTDHDPLLADGERRPPWHL